MTFCEHIRNLILSDPEAQERVFVTDQLNTHQSESLVGLVGELCGIKDDSGVKGKKGILIKKICRNKMAGFIH